MSLNYAASLSQNANKGKCGQPEHFDSDDELECKINELVNVIKSSEYMVVITGAGISTSCGIPDFRGPNGVWTLEGKGEKPNFNVSFDQAKPSFSHFALVELEKLGILKFLISQNIDGLHHRSGFPLEKLAELHGNVFMEKCNTCNTKYLNTKSINSVGLKSTGKKCTIAKIRGTCRGELHDTLLDWEDELPKEELSLSERACKQADLCLCLGTSLQIMPCGNFPIQTLKKNGKIVMINLQKTKMDKNAFIVIHAKLDDVLQRVFNKMNINLSDCNEKILLKSQNIADLDKKICLNVKNIILNE